MVHPVSHFFNYNTGQKYSGIVHNPHHTEWLENNIRERCDNNTSYIYENCLRHQIVDTMGISNNMICVLLKFESVINQIKLVINSAIAPVIDDYSQTNAKHREMRIRYLVNEITEKQFKQFLFKAHKANIRAIDIRDLLMFIIEAIESIIQNVLIKKNKNDMCKQMHNLEEYVNEQIKRINSLYNCRSLIFSIEQKTGHVTFNLATKLK